MLFKDSYSTIFYEEYLREKKALSESSIYTYVHSIEKFLKTRPNIQNLEDYNNFLIQLTIKKRSTHYYSVLKSFIEYTISDANLRDGLIKGLVRSRIRTDLARPRRHLSQDKIIQVINHLSRRKHRIIALIQSLTGARAGDILKMKRGSMMIEDYEGKEVLRVNTRAKGNKSNVVYIHDIVAIQLILNYVTTVLNFNDYYFIELGRYNNRPGQQDNENMLVKMNYQQFWNDLKQALNTVGVNRQDFATHDFRRCFARRVWEKFKDVHVLQGLLNHKNPQTTMRYLEQSGLKNIDYYFKMQT